MIKDIAFTAYPSKDVAKLRGWYEQNLGLQFSGPYEEDGVEKYNEAKVGSGYFAIVWNEWMERPAGSASGIAFEVDNIDDAVTELRTKGVAAGDPYETPVCKISSFDDLEGNRITLHQITVPH